MTSREGTRSALIIASDQYSDPGLRRLRAPASDARALAAVLQDPGIGGFEVRTLTNEPAHTVNLAVEEFFIDRRPDDLLLVHFSGHGIKDQDGELYFAASNTQLGRLAATAVAAEFLTRRMTRGRSRRVVLLLDCCYAGAFARGLVARAAEEIGIEQQFGGRCRAVITASSAMEYAFEEGELADTREVPPSVFTSALVRGLETGEADRDQDGQVGLDELYDYVYDEVRAATPNQTPGKWTLGMEGEQLYIARRSRPITTPAVLSADLEQAIDSPLAKVRTGAVEELARMLRGRHGGMVLAARLALQQLTGDDSRAVAAAATAALGIHAPVPSPPSRPELALSATVIDLGRLPQHGQSPEHRVQISNAGGENLNARAATSASCLKLRQVGDELVVTADTSATGEYEGTITGESDGGAATIGVHGQVASAPLPATETQEELRSLPSRARRRRRCILVVDDTSSDLVARKIMGHKVVTITSPGEWEEFCDSGRLQGVHGALVDLHLEADLLDVKGQEVLRVLRDDTCIPAALMSIHPPVEADRDFVDEFRLVGVFSKGTAGTRLLDELVSRAVPRLVGDDEEDRRRRMNAFVRSAWFLRRRRLMRPGMPSRSVEELADLERRFKDVSEMMEHGDVRQAETEARRFLTDFVPPDRNRDLP